MTIEEILAALDSLKDYVNDQTKPTIEHIKAGVRSLAEKRKVEFVPHEGETVSDPIPQASFPEEDEEPEPKHARGHLRGRKRSSKVS